MTREEAFGQRLRRMRLARGLSQEQLAAGGVVSASYVSLLEAGSRSPSKKALSHLAQRLGVDEGELSTGRRRADDAEWRLRFGFAEIQRRNGDYQEARDAFEALASEASTDEQRSDCRWGLATCLEGLGLLDEAAAAYKSLTDQAARSAGSVSWLKAATAACRCLREAGRLEESVAFGEAAIGEAHECGLSGSEPAIELRSTQAFGYIELGQLERSQELLQEALSLSEALGSRRSRGAALWNLSVLAHERGDTATAIDFAERALFLFAEEEDQRASARLKNLMAGLLLRMPDPNVGEAARLLSQARETLQRAGTAADLAYVDTELARVAFLEGDPGRAVAIAQAALMTLPEGALESARCRLVIADAWHRLGDFEAATAATDLAAQLLSDMGAVRQAATGWAELATRYEQLGDSAKALHAWKQASAAVGVRATLPRAVQRLVVE